MTGPKPAQTLAAEFDYALKRTCCTAVWQSANNNGEHEKAEKFW